MNNLKRLNSLDDNDLMEQVKEGDIRQMGKLFDQHHRPLFGYFFRITSDAAQSEDMVQNVFYRMLKYRQSFRSKGKFVYWMYTIARNVFKDEYRSNEPSSQASELLDDHLLIADDEDDYKEQLERRKMLRRAMMKLPKEKREAIILSRYQGLRYQEIAVLTNVSENAIKARVRRAILDLQDFVAKETEELN